ncbi:BlaI/MecI/CopY family transcriptional regulator [Curtobacterium sp. Csp1]|uniref:BlaI/MecI/CopY family transcriptional regulator n=1 Tax=Curtobacterium sp. Csp1 TaxID=2495429 RepID=UPI0015985EBB|nr:BlaI/MecI/CopY family transcriptional regulator [Curtobacterium sp. Csp1]QKS19428.1 BlaI/MecI/CopY family transcriptional regulator [Curtobacterium sp. Csp1]
MSPRRAHGSLEASVLQLLWAQDAPQTGRQIRDALAEDGDPLASTTVLTVLARLEKKGLVERDPASKAYQPTRADPARTADSMTEVLGRSSDRSAVLQRFTGALGADDLQVLRAALSGAGMSGTGVDRAEA